MSLVKPINWEFWMGDMPMPEDCNYETMWAMYDAIKKIEDKDYALEQVHFYEDWFRKTLPRFKSLQRVFTPSDDPNINQETTKLMLSDYQQDWDNVQEIMKWLKEQILYWREEFTKL